MSISLPLPHYPPVPYLSLTSTSTFTSLCPSPNLSLYAFISQFPFPFWIVSPDLSLFPLNILPPLPLYSLYVHPFPNVSPPNLSLSLPPSTTNSLLLISAFCQTSKWIFPSLYLCSSLLSQSLSILPPSLSMFPLSLNLTHTFIQVFQTVSSLPLCYWTLHCQSFIDFSTFSNELFKGLNILHLFFKPLLWKTGW